MADAHSSDRENTRIVHASCVALGDRALLILGASGSGKSSLALEMLAMGCTLVADDRTELCRSDAGLTARPPRAIAGLIEARGVGLLRARFVEDVAISFAVDLDRREPERLPALHHVEMFGQKLICLAKAETACFPAALLQMLKDGRAEPT